MATGAGIMGLGLFLLALSVNLTMFWMSWALTGLAGAMFLTTSAYAYIAEYAADRARSLIGTLMLVTGLAGSIFWPITTFLDHGLGWRGAVSIYAGIMLMVVCPLVFLACRSPMKRLSPRRDQAVREEGGFLSFWSPPSP